MSPTESASTNEYMLDIVGTQSFSDESTSVETHCPCTLTRRNNKLYIQYIEEDVSRLITIDGRHVQLRALGDLASRLEFDCSRTTSGEYHTPYGTLSIRISTSVLTVSDNIDTGNELRLYMEYTLASSDNIISENVLSLTVTGI